MELRRTKLFEKELFAEHTDCISAEGKDFPNKAQLTGAVEYTDCISAEGWDFPNEPQLAWAAKSTDCIFAKG